MKTSGQHPILVDDAARFATVVDRHQRRRHEGLPTITTIVGPTSLALRCWQRFFRELVDQADGTGNIHAVVPVVVEPYEDWFATWSTWLLRGDVLWNAATAEAANSLNQPVEVFRERVRNTSRYDLRRRLQHSGLDVDDTRGGTLAARLICGVGGSDSPISPDLSPSLSAVRVGGDSDALREVVALLPSEDIPPLAFRIGDLDGLAARKTLQECCSKRSAKPFASRPLHQRCRLLFSSHHKFGVKPGRPYPTDSRNRLPAKTWSRCGVCPRPRFARGSRPINHRIVNHPKKSGDRTTRPRQIPRIAGAGN